MKKIYDAVVVGAGPGGLTAALYTARAGMETLVIEGESSTSQVTITDMIENYPGFPEGISGYDLLDRFKKQVLALGVKVVVQDVRALVRAKQEGQDIWEIAVAEGEPFLAHTVIAATGTSWRRLNVAGEEEFIGRGVSFCATCDGPLYRAKEVIVVGGGSAAVQEALFLTNFANKVTLVHRRAELRADKILQQRAFDNGKIDFVWNAVIEEIQGEKTVSGVIVKDVHSGELRRIATNGIFVFIGSVPNTEMFKNVLQRSASGALVVDRNMATSAAGVFACGDCVDKDFRQVVNACGEGAVAANAAYHFADGLSRSIPQKARHTCVQGRGK
ncbi:MAG: thioredoxin-disulfide reductase [Deltaproteobacteria bacterium]|nr:thioredoxin-disulfide reductase [Deltaproteobacteria bacterium]